MEYTRLVTGKTVAVLFEELGYRYVIYLYAAQTNYLTCLCTVLLKRNVNMHCLKKRPIEILNKWCHLMGGFLLQETELDIFISISLRMRRVHSTWKAVIIWTVCLCFVVRTIYYMVFEIAPPPYVWIWIVESQAKYMFFVLSCFIYTLIVEKKNIITKWDTRKDLKLLIYLWRAYFRYDSIYKDIKIYIFWKFALSYSRKLISWQNLKTYNYITFIYLSLYVKSGWCMLTWK